MYDVDTRQGKPTVIVTGSSGLLGTAVIKALAAHYRLIGFDRAGPPHPPPEAACVSVDVTQPNTIHRGLEDVYAASGARIASVIHLAAYYDFSGWLHADGLCLNGGPWAARSTTSCQAL